MKRIRSCISTGCVILLSAGLMIPALQLHEMAEWQDHDPDEGQTFVSDHFYCPVCQAVFNFTADDDAGQEYLSHAGDEKIPFIQQILPSRTFSSKEGRSPPAVG